MKIPVTLYIFFIFFTVKVSAQQSPVNWSRKGIFNNAVFIENKGQFSQEEERAAGEPILFSSRKGMQYLYFTKHAIILRYDSIYTETDDDDKKGKEDKDDAINVKHLYKKLHWHKAKTDTVEAGEPTNDYFTYNNPRDKSGKSGIKAQAWKKLVYKNMYAGIDLELSYKESGSLAYHLVSKNGEANDISSTSVSITQTIKLLTNWQTTTSLHDSNRAYDVDCDMHGNVYLYGGLPPCQLQKYTNTGSLLWTYTTNFSGGAGAGTSCGDLTVNVHNGTSYICDAGNLSGCQIAKVNSLGNLEILRAPYDTIWEMWKIRYDYCNNELVIGVGNAGSLNQACTADTDINPLKVANVLSIKTSYYDIGLLTLDHAGNSYFATMRTLNTTDSTYANFLVKTPLPSLSPTSYKISDGYHFVELASLVDIYGYFSESNAFNGMAANVEHLFMYNGAQLQKRSSATGAIIKKLQLTDTSFLWSGLDIDCAENIYAGDNDSVILLDSALSRIGYVQLPNTVYDVKVGYTGQVYVCGVGFVAAFNALVPPPKLTTTSTPSTSCAGCNGAASASVSCRTDNTYQWNTGKTTQAITDLCPGSYTVIANACSPVPDTALVTITGKEGLTVSQADTNPRCSITPGSITAYPSYGSPPYTYLWNNGPTTQTITNLMPGSYTCTITDSAGCKDTIVSTLVYNPPLPDINIVSYYGTICSNCPDTIVVSGAQKYSWNPSTGLSCSDCPNPVATISNTTTYTVTGTDSLGCESERIITILLELHCGDFIIPNVFTPNGDGINDFFEIHIPGTELYSILIYDRWGQEVYTSNDPEKYWDGNTKSGTKAPDGVYYYIINYSCQGNTYKKDGFVQLIQ